ncbi:SulP family inorganic anion transporter [Actimicrobium sp. CCI2.3]|uniref:SulP family inorganic anion transporter n=1 Tax=Actimicrobium sp. CCI2.3 TaxID=3048616 RepID=UPI002AB48AC5|nr:SulP family inorganic anion transporter [Actimicrobium sp. CCI2.3]MDY7572694.1 SulP family inorganic anion transporter [Actimicrobium sp. CCI2.3]MEB0022213.1 SulP family inorganic anion transporter [Actimicrobium sp. CCI2.3]
MSVPRLPWPDLLAGLSLAGLLLPEAVAYASIAGLPPQAGVIALFAGLLCYALLGTSRFAIVSATSSSAAVLAAAATSVGGVDLSLRLTAAIGLVLVTGLLFTAASAARIGSVSDFIAKPVLRGFAFGLALVIVFKQCASVLGASLHHTDIVRQLIDLGDQFATWNWAAALLALCALVLLILFARLPHLPGGVLVITLGIVAGHWIDLAHYGIGRVGDISLQFAAPSVPLLSYPQWLRLAELGVAMVLILYAESYSSIRTFAMKHGDAVTPNRDLLALGVANLLSGLFQGMPVGAGYSATSANEAAGAVSRLAGFAAVVTLLVVVLTLLPQVALTPTPVLAAIVIYAVSHTLRLAVFRPYFTWRRDRLIVLLAVLCVLAFGVLDGLLASIAISLLMLLQRLSASSVSVLGRLGTSHDFVDCNAWPDAHRIPHMLILRPETGLFFANAERILTQVQNTITRTGGDVRTIILSLEESPDLDSSTIEALVNFHAALRAQHKQLLFARLKTAARHVLLRAQIVGLDPAALSELSVDDAVHMALLAETDTTSLSE